MEDFLVEYKHIVLVWFCIQVGYHNPESLCFVTSSKVFELLEVCKVDLAMSQAGVQVCKRRVWMVGAPKDPTTSLAKWRSQKPFIAALDSLLVIDSGCGPPLMLVIGVCVTMATARPAPVCYRIVGGWMGDVTDRGAGLSPWALVVLEGGLGGPINHLSLGTSGVPPHP